MFSSLSMVSTYPLKSLSCGFWFQLMRCSPRLVYKGFNVWWGCQFVSFQVVATHRIYLGVSLSICIASCISTSNLGISYFYLFIYFFGGVRLEVVFFLMFLYVCVYLSCSIHGLSYTRVILSLYLYVYFFFPSVDVLHSLPLSLLPVCVYVCVSLSPSSSLSAIT